MVRRQTKEYIRVQVHCVRLLRRETQQLYTLQDSKTLFGSHVIQKLLSYPSNEGERQARGISSSPSAGCGSKAPDEDIGRLQQYAQ